MFVNLVGKRRKPQTNQAANLQAKKRVATQDKTAADVQKAVPGGN